MSDLVMSVIERFLVFADPKWPVTKAAGQEGPQRSRINHTAITASRRRIATGSRNGQSPEGESGRRA